MAEWFMAPVLKTGGAEMYPGVRIPLLPPNRHPHADADLASRPLQGADKKRWFDCYA